MKLFSFEKIKIQFRQFVKLLKFPKKQNSLSQLSLPKTKNERSKKMKDKKSEELEESLYSLDEYQLNNLLDKKINFRFYSLDSFPENTLLIPGLQKAQFKTKEDIQAELKGQDFNQPLVLICQKGDKSKAFSQTLREAGFINCYYLKKGFSSGLK